MKKNLLIAVFISFVNALSISVVVPIIYVYGKSFGLTDFQSSLLLTSYSLFQFLATPIIGRLSDYYGRKPLLAISLFGTFVSNILAALAPSAAFLFIARILDGITGGNNSVAQAVISDTTTPAERAKAFGLFGASFGLAFIVGPVISLFAQRISLSTPYLLSAFMALIATLLTVFILPETLVKKETKRLEFSNIGFKQIITGLTLPIIGVFLLINFLTSLSVGMFQFSFQLFLINVLHKSTEDITIILILYGLVSVIMQAGVIRFLLTRVSEMSLLVFSLLSSGIILSVMPLFGDYSLFIIFTILFAIVGSLSRPVLISLISKNTNAEDQGGTLGLTESYFSLATSIGPLLGGAIVSLGYSIPLILAGVLNIGTGLFALSKRSVVRIAKKVNL